MTKRHLIIATRESPLAMQQALEIKTQLQTIHPHLAVDILGMTTKADELLEIKLTDIGGKGLFVKELEEALLDGRADIAVHSMKDVPMDLPEGLILPVMTKRAEPRDVFVSNHYATLSELPTSAMVGTSSLRRQTQIRHGRSDLVMKDIRGNINTRLKRLDQGDFDALILAGAGLIRMQLASRIKSYLSIDESLPSAGQGALGIECLAQNEATLALIKPLNHHLTYQAVSAERALCKQLGGGCQVPVAAYADIHHDQLTLRGLVANHNGMQIIRATLKGHEKEAENIGKRVAEELIQQGALKILREFKK